MAEVTSQMITELRQRTGAGFADCKKALNETGADMDKAIEYLRKKGMATLAKKAGRVASEGTVATYLHGTRIAVLVEVNCETDFVGRSADFQGFAREVAMQVAAMKPQYVSSDEIPAAILEKEREILTEKTKASGKPEAVWPKIVEGQLKKWFTEICLLDQPWVKDDKKDIRTLMTELAAKIGENIKVRRFVRFEVGEGLEKKADDFVEEVKRQAGTS